MLVKFVKLFTLSNVNNFSNGDIVEIIANDGRYYSGEIHSFNDYTITLECANSKWFEFIDFKDIMKITLL